MKLLDLFKSRSRYFYAIVYVVSIISSIANIGLLILINDIIRQQYTGEHFNVNYIASFVGLLVVSFVASAYFQRSLVGITNEIMCEMELSIIQKVRKATYASFEKLGYEKLYSAFADTQIVSNIPGSIINVFTAVITIVCALVYIFFTSPMSGVFLFILMILFLVIYVVNDSKNAQKMEQVRDLQDEYYGHLREFLMAFRQIKISGTRNNTIYNKHLLKNRNDTKQIKTKLYQKYAINELFGTYSWFVLLGVVIFILPWLLGISIIQVTTLVTTIIFLIAPLAKVMTFIPSYNRFKIAINRINRIEKLLIVDAKPIFEKTVHDSFQTIRFENISYQYGDNEQGAFTLQIPELTLNRNEITFITGGNGSGKTTFINILTGLYRPDSGRIFIDDNEIDWQQYAQFCNNMSVIFSDHHLFRHNYDEHDLSEANTELQRLVKKKNLEKVFKVDSNKIDVNLSKGQQKRTALILSLLEDKSMVILDEWAAEQDPFNKNEFYSQWIYDIKSSGRMLLAITHDDEHYAKADRIIRFKNGSVAEDIRNQELSYDC
ncbi:ATP-binding cassette domain-containing protein [Fulvivirga ulvae]|uniref:ATP-binding cassette domain-containing protein n=1 Tax=Fulvivirga ulvae TaxID=2904245 RepID=UPI001F432664|nr:ATP-binding cassette domain-containing protein [Fulvivirga ulvae]UII31898.1 ATP-binding cassette domain-containing protein [Fulvivirga ulvae]